VAGDNTVTFLSFFELNDNINNSSIHPTAPVHLKSVSLVHVNGKLYFFSKTRSTKWTSQLLGLGLYAGQDGSQ